MRLRLQSDHRDLPIHNANELSMRISGTVKVFNSAKGFGFITPDGAALH